MKNFKKQNGIALLTMILIVVVALVVVIGGALIIRSAVTGEEVLAPVKEFFGAEEADEDDEKTADKEDKEDKKDNDEEDVTVDEEDDEEETKKEDDDKVTSDDKDDLIHYHGDIDFNDYTGGAELEFSEYIEMSADFYATETEIEEIVFEFDLKEFLEKYYEAYEEDMIASGYDTYESFRDLMMETFETSFTSGFESSGSAMNDYFRVDYPREETMVLTITDGGISNIYSNYGLEEGDSVTEILEGFEEALNIELKEV